MFKGRFTGLGRKDRHGDDDAVPDALAYDDSGVPLQTESIDLTGGADMSAPPGVFVPNDARSAGEGDFDASIDQGAPADLRAVETADHQATQAAPQGATALQPAGWFDDPMNSHMVRWWDGSTWTGHVLSRPAGA